MNMRSLFQDIAGWIAAIPRLDLLYAAFAAMIVGWIGTSMIRRRLPFGKTVSALGTVMLVGILITVMLQMSRFDPRIEMAVPELGLPKQVVEGGETRVPLAADGHYWLEAEINGVRANFLVDTGATLTAVNAGLAKRADIEPRRGGLPIQLNTANGTVSAQIGSIDELRFGNVAARGLDAVIAPNLGDTNVIGMNLLSRLKGWRVEQGDLILVPNNPQPTLQPE